jgi:hypothetical protein
VQGNPFEKEAGYVKVAGKSNQELVLMPVSELKTFFEGLQLDMNTTVAIAKRILIEIKNRLIFLCDVGPGISHSKPAFINTFWRRITTDKSCHIAGQQFGGFALHSG